jgi:Ca2+-binding EF-hand superfamily protein
MMNGINSNMVSTWANNLFARLDTQNQGYIEKSGLQSALSTATGSSTSVDDVFTRLDGDSDGKVTKDEMTTALQNLFAQTNSWTDSTGMNIGGPPPSGGAPPPPPMEGNEAGFTKEELTDQLEEIGSTDSKRSSFISGIIENFDAADTDGDGKVSLEEAIAYDKTKQTGSAPPPPPMEGNKAGFTKEELTDQLEEIGSTDSKRSSFISGVIENFEAADTDGDGKVSLEEAMAYDETQQTSLSGKVALDEATSSADNENDDVRMIVMKLLKAYQAFDVHSNESDAPDKLSVTA